MIEQHYHLLKWIALLLTFAWIGWTVHDSLMSSDEVIGNHAYFAGNTFFEDGYYLRALQEYDQALQENVDHTPALRGKANSLIQLTRYQESLSIFNQLIEREPQFSGNYANRGILHDRMGRYQEALADYERALQMDDSLAEGPNWLTRFFRLQPQKPPTIAERAVYLRNQLAKPKEAQILTIPELDQQQLPYKKH